MTTTKAQFKKEELTKITSYHQNHILDLYDSSVFGFVDMLTIGAFLGSCQLFGMTTNIFP
jgi:hypothetical protein